MLLQCPCTLKFIFDIFVFFVNTFMQIYKHFLNNISTSECFLCSKLHYHLCDAFLYELRPSTLVVCTSCEQPVIIVAIIPMTTAFFSNSKTQLCKIMVKALHKLILCAFYISFRHFLLFQQQYPDNL